MPLGCIGCVIGHMVPLEYINGDIGHLVPLGGIERDMVQHCDIGHVVPLGGRNGNIYRPRSCGPTWRYISCYRSCNCHVYIHAHMVQLEGKHKNIGHTYGATGTYK